ncbi:SMI1/KNR4 family protein [uncultured Streptomyces sp.]|uniref:SMI1/KNR4 family protein n=1 Tax=uncultured Streptomyces sp. TaxID=174707 RepID=UPI002619E65F|nr:SMI1/KNR4 family protein [uncultured Streptomyces sp.]
MTDDSVATFDAAWNRFTGWMAAHVPIDLAALRPAATAEEITDLETRLGFPLHPHLKALLGRHDGVIPHPEPQHHYAGAFLPLSHRLLGTEAIATAQEHLANGLGEAVAVLSCGDDLYDHAHQWVPFARPNDGGTAFIDHRPGPTYGHVYEMGLGSGATEATGWAVDLAGLFDALATSLESDTPFVGWWPEPLELRSGHTCLGWDHSARPVGSGWPAPRTPVPAVRPARHENRKLGRLLGTLKPDGRRSPGEGPQGPVRQ